MLKSLVSGARKLATGQGGGAPMGHLFPKVDPKVDGDDCLRDCENCPTHYPKGFKIQESDDLYGGVKGWSTHVLVATGKSDWAHNVADEKGSVMQAIEKADRPSNGRLMLSASNMPTPGHSSDYSEPTTLLLLPAFVVIENVTPASVPALISGYISRSPTSASALQPVSASIPDSPPPRSLPDPAPGREGLKSRPSPHSVLILLCSQKTRDARCGQSAPLIKKELQRHLRPLGLYRDLDDERPGGVGIYFISHVGGHKYSANMMIYRRPDAFGLDGLQRANLGEGESLTPRIREDPADGPGGDTGAGQCIWLARVRPEDCEGIVRYTVLQGKVVKPEQQLRGGFDRSRGVMSW